ncbi:MAG: trimeric intracellular cation channel family protein [Shewanellaceae bacterium]|nr:trimeric intracellular cation channel family protein [Shewanellaceae bacterium]
MPSFHSFLYAFDLFGTAVFAMTGLLTATRHKMDLFGCFILALVTAIGGGTLRDMMLGATPIFWLEDTLYFWVILSTLLCCVLLSQRYSIAIKYLPHADAIGLAVFAVLGTNKALEMGCSPAIATFMGMLSGIGGGMIRDVFCQQIPYIFKQEIYATAAMIGGVLYSMLFILQVDTHISMLLAVAATLGIRLGAIQWHWTLPSLASRIQTH